MKRVSDEDLDLVFREAFDLLTVEAFIAWCSVKDELLALRRVADAASDLEVGERGVPTIRRRAKARMADALRDKTPTATSRTAFDDFFAEQVADPANAEAYAKARAEIDAVDAPPPRKPPMGCGKSIEVWLPGGGRGLRPCGRSFGTLRLCEDCQKLRHKGTP